ncbi:MAG TPA: hypothetical protein VNI79_07475 [Sphingomicrobium sp.]|nr:hypothetical protein [Sphingomicrobium sp.]
MTARATKKRVSWAALLTCEEAPVFSAATTKNLLLAVDLKLSRGWTEKDFQVVLNELAVRFALGRYEETNPDEPASEKKALKLERACRAILREIGADRSEQDIDPAFGRYGLYRVASARGAQSGKDTVLEKVRAISALARDARALATVSARRRALHSRPPGPVEQAAIKRLVAGLSELYFVAGGNLPGIARDYDTHRPNGRFVKLLCRVHEHLLARNLDTMVREPDALAQIWNRLSDDEKLTDLKGLAKPLSAMDELK